jgi:hypothetical protein
VLLASRLPQDNTLPQTRISDYENLIPSSHG